MKLLMKLLRKLGFLKPLSSIEHALEVVERTKPGEWTTHTVIDGFGCSCFLGHMVKSFGGTPINTSQALAIPQVREIDEKIVEYCEKKHKQFISHSHEINDNALVNGYTEDHPRDRMLHVLRDMKADGWDKK